MFKEMLPKNTYGEIEVEIALNINGNEMLLFIIIIINPDFLRA